MSMSVYLNKYPKIKNSYKKMTPAIWIPSSKITKCYDCKESLLYLDESIIVEYYFPVDDDRRFKNV